MQTRLNWRNLGWAVYLSAALLVIVAAFFLFELFSFNENAGEVEAVSVTAYRSRVDSLLASANSANAEAAIAKYACAACHRDGADNGIAPAWEGLAERADDRRPPMPADAYLYESIVHPGAFVVEGFPNSMPQNYVSRMTDQELGDIIAYLLTPEAR